MQYCVIDVYRTSASNYIDVGTRFSVYLFAFIKQDNFIEIRSSFRFILLLH